MSKKRRIDKSLILIILSLIPLLLFIIGFKDYFLLFNNLILFIFFFVLSFNVIGVLLLIYSKYNQKIYKLSYVISIVSICITIICFLFISIININIHKTYDNDIYYQEGYISYNSKNNSFTSIDEIKNNGLTIGVIIDEDSDYYGKESLEKSFNNYSLQYYGNDFSLFKALVSDDIDIAVFSKYYKMSVRSNEDYSYIKYLDNVSDLYKFKDKAIRVKEKLDDKTFNVLLIGFAPENEEETVGSADGIMIATINLKSLSVNLTSIPRSTEVTYACAGNIRDRISGTINYSELCLMKTVEDFMSVDIDYYVKFDFNAIVDIVDAIGGIVIDNPVEFVGQTSSSTRGEYTIYIPAGENVFVDGQEALAFIRERYAYSTENDSQRQSNQQQVLSRIVEKLLGSKNPLDYIKVANAFGGNVRTNISKGELFGILNNLLNIKDNTGISLYAKLDFSNYKLYGSYVSSYSYYLRSPMSIFKIYQKSIDDSINKINDVLNNYTIKDINQSSLFGFLVDYPYFKTSQDTDFSDEILGDDDIPNYYPLLVGKSLDEVNNWAKENNVKLTIEYIKENDEGYDKDNIGNVVYQSVQYGSLVEENKECTIKVIKSS